jgi:hypothetical protein
MNSWYNRSFHSTPSSWGELLSVVGGAGCLLFFFDDGIDVAKRLRGNSTELQCSANGPEKERTSRNKLQQKKEDHEIRKDHWE